MKNLDLATLGVEEMNEVEMQEVDGGFVPLVVFGIALSAKAVAGAAGACFLAGVGIGSAVYLSQR